MPAFLDVDGLKRINDTHGHDAGDDLIADVAEVLRAPVQPTAVLARMGGDEFCVLATAADGGPPVLKERLCAAFDAFNATRDRPYRISASIGLVRARAAGCPTVDELLARADELMDAEKKAKPGSRLSE